MVQLTLPKNSRIVEGKTWPKPAGAKRLVEYKIYRYDPDDGEQSAASTPIASTSTIAGRWSSTGSSGSRTRSTRR